MGAARYGAQTSWKFSYVCCVVVFLYVLTASCYGDSIEHLEEVERKHIQQSVCCAFLRVVDMCPGIVLCLCGTEYILDGAIHIQFVVDEALVALVSKLQLVLQVVETVVHRSCTEHQDLRTHTGTNHLVHQTQVAILTRVGILFVSSHLASVTEVMTFVYDDKVVVAPVQK